MIQSIIMASLILWTSGKTTKTLYPSLLLRPLQTILAGTLPKKLYVFTHSAEHMDTSLFSIRVCLQSLITLHRYRRRPGWVHDRKIHNRNEAFFKVIIAITCQHQCRSVYKKMKKDSVPSDRKSSTNKTWHSSWFWFLRLLPFQPI